MSEPITVVPIYTIKTEMKNLSKTLKELALALWIPEFFKVIMLNKFYSIDYWNPPKLQGLMSKL